MTIENGGDKRLGNSFNAWTASVFPVSHVVKISTNGLRALRVEMLCVISRIEDELKRRERGHHA